MFRTLINFASWMRQDAYLILPFIRYLRVSAIFKYSFPRCFFNNTTAGELFLYISPDDQFSTKSSIQAWIELSFASWVSWTTWLVLLVVSRFWFPTNIWAAVSNLRNFSSSFLISPRSLEYSWFNSRLDLSVTTAASSGS